jgi:hypothetical protein
MFAHILRRYMSASRTVTYEILGRTLTHPGLVEDVERRHRFAIPCYVLRNLGGENPTRRLLIARLLDGIACVDASTDAVFSASVSVISTVENWV